jgi:cyclase
MAVTEVLPGLYIADHRVADGKNGIILGQRGALAVDVGTYPEEGQVMFDFIRAQGYEPNRVVLTHGHGDHVLGGAAFAGAEIYARAETPAVCRRFLTNLAASKGVPYEQLADQALWPTVMYTDELRIDLGDKRVRLFPTPGHSEDGVSVYIEEQRALIAGDSVVTSIVPAIGDGDSRVLEASLRGLLAMEIDVLIPGHGSVQHDPQQVRDALQWLLGYLSEVRAFVQQMMAADSTLDAEQIADRVTYKKFVGDRFPADQHGMPTRHRNTVMKMIEEEMVRQT